MVELVKAGLATARGERVRAGDRVIEVATLRITDAGRAAISSADLVVNRDAKKRTAPAAEVRAGALSGSLGLIARFANENFKSGRRSRPTSRNARPR
jgi:hypothetical protein